MIKRIVVLGSGVRGLGLILARELMAQSGAQVIVEPVERPSPNAEVATQLEGMLRDTMQYCGHFSEPKVRHTAQWKQETRRYGKRR